MLVASVLAVVAGSAAQAANTASEVLVDTDDDGVGDAREFGGRDRYDTALRLAANFGAAKGLGNVPVAFVASGESLVDAVSVSGLAGFFDAPVLLTPSDSLHGGVADFVEDYGVGTVHVLGGSGAVADSVVEDLEALANGPTVNRVAGADRYATAAAAAGLLGGGAAWCGGEDAAAVLVNGGDVSLVDAMMVGPIAYRLQLPVLLTSAGVLASATADFIEANDIEHVVIVGGADAVSADVADAVSDSGVDTVTRVAGDTPAGTSVALAELAFDGCADDLAPVSDDTVALVHRDALPDGVASAPVLASTFAAGTLVPVLVVGDTLPAAVRDYLAATAEEDADGNKVHFNILAIGGTAAVSSDVMDAAVAAAASAPSLTVQIGATQDKNGDNVIDVNDVPADSDTAVILYFSDNVIGAGADGLAQLTDMIRDVIELNGAPALLAATPVTHTDNSDNCVPDQVTVTFENPLKAGDTVAVAAGLKLGADNDQRTVGGASVTVPALVPDRTRPTVNVIGIVDEGTFRVYITEDNLPASEALTADDFELNSSLGSTLGTVTWDAAATSATVAVVNTASNVIQAGDRLTVKSGAVVDAAGNRSLQRSFTAIAPHKSPRITSVLLSNLNHTDQATIPVPAPFAAAATAPTITAKPDGAAAGAAGNGWSLVFDVLSTWEDDEDAAVDIDVWVNQRDREVSVRFNTGKATNGDLEAALEANSAFDALFDVELAVVECASTARTELSLSTATTHRQITADLALGETKVAIQVTFNGYISDVDNGRLLADVLAETVERADNAGVMDEDSNGLVDEVREGLAIDSGNLGDGGNVVVSYPGTKVTYNATTDNVVLLPQVRDLIVTTAGTTADDDHVAVGYADDDAATEDQDEEENGASRVFIGRSSGVEAPK